MFQDFGQYIGYKQYFVLLGLIFPVATAIYRRSSRTANSRMATLTRHESRFPANSRCDHWRWIREFCVRHFIADNPLNCRSTIGGAGNSGQCLGCKYLTPLDAVVRAATGCNASARVSALVPKILKRPMKKEKTKTSKPRHATEHLSHRNSSTTDRRSVEPRPRRWDPTGVSVEFEPPASVLESEVKTIEAFLKDQINEILRRRN